MGGTHSLVLIIKLHIVCMITRLPKENKTISEILKIVQETTEKLYSWDRKDGWLPLDADKLDWIAQGTVHTGKKNKKDFFA